MPNTSPSSANEKLAMKVSINSIIVNVLLSAFKLFAGLVANSAAMISDSIHSASDVFSTFIVIIGVKIAGKASDAEHQYGHERLEYIASILLSFILFLTGCGIGYAGLNNILSDSYAHLKMPGQLALVAAVVSIVVKEAMYWYTKFAADKIHSGALMADAWHHRSDALSSIGSFIGIFGARLGYPVLDSVASVVICLLIIKASFDIFKDAIDKLVDRSCDTTTLAAMQACVLAQPGVLGLDKLQTRMFGSKYYVDIEIAADGDQPLRAAHRIAEHVHHAIETDFPEVKHCMVHVNPRKTEHNFLAKD
ncbi:MAG: cation diffusion facilitator family transporter [Acidaminococcaceae bacterium]